MREALLRFGDYDVKVERLEFPGQLPSVKLWAGWHDPETVLLGGRRFLAGYRDILSNGPSYLPKQALPTDAAPRRLPRLG
jgi:hypothetical protein